MKTDSGPFCTACRNGGKRTVGQSQGYGAMVVGRKDEGTREGVPRVDEETFQRLTLTEPPRRIVIKERNP